MSEKKDHGPLEGRVGVLPPNPPPQQRQQFAPQAGPVVGGLVPGQEDDQALKPKETIPGGLYINPSGHYVNAANDYVDATGKVIEKDKNGNVKPVKAKRGETPVQDHLAAQEKAAPDNAEEGEEA